MVIKFLFYSCLLFIACCSSERLIKEDEPRAVVVGDYATLSDLAYVVNNWKPIKGAILSGDTRDCVQSDLSIGHLIFVDLEPVQRVSLYNPDYAKIQKSKGIMIYRLGFVDPCGGRTDKATDPHWIVADDGEFKLINFLQIVE